MGRGVLYAVRATSACRNNGRMVGSGVFYAGMARCYGKSRVKLVGRQSPASKCVNTEAEEATELEAVTSKLTRVRACCTEL
jgi:hypothetical protein